VGLSDYKINQQILSAKKLWNKKVHCCSKVWNHFWWKPWCIDFFSTLWWI